MSTARVTFKSVHDRNKSSVLIRVKNGPRGRYKIAEHMTKQRSLFKKTTMHKTLIEIERGLNRGMTCDEAEVAYARMGKHSEPIYMATATSASGLKIY